LAGVIGAWNLFATKYSDINPKEILGSGFDFKNHCFDHFRLR